MSNYDIITVTSPILPSFAEFHELLKEEGVRREYVYKRGEWRDLVVVGVLESDYRRIIESNHYWD